MSSFFRFFDQPVPGQGEARPPPEDWPVPMPRRKAEPRTPIVVPVPAKAVEPKRNAAPVRFGMALPTTRAVRDARRM